MPQSLRVFLVVGVLGGFTTFSAFALDALLLFERGAAGAAAAYVLASVLGCLLAAGVAYGRRDRRAALRITDSESRPAYCCSTS